MSRLLFFIEICILSSFLQQILFFVSPHSKLVYKFQDVVISNIFELLPLTWKILNLLDLSFHCVFIVRLAVSCAHCYANIGNKFVLPYTIINAESLQSIHIFLYLTQLLSLIQLNIFIVWIRYIIWNELNFNYERGRILHFQSKVWNKIYNSWYVQKIENLSVRSIFILKCKLLIYYTLYFCTPFKIDRELGCFLD